MRQQVPPEGNSTRGSHQLLPHVGKPRLIWPVRGNEDHDALSPFCIIPEAQSLTAGMHKVWLSVRVPPISSEQHSKKNNGQCVFSLVTNRSTSAIPKRSQNNANWTEMKPPLPARNSVSVEQAVPVWSGAKLRWSLCALEKEAGLHLESKHTSRYVIDWFRLNMLFCIFTHSPRDSRRSSSTSVWLTSTYHEWAKNQSVVQIIQNVHTVSSERGKRTTHFENVYGAKASGMGALNTGRLCPRKQRKRLWYCAIWIWKYDSFRSINENQSLGWICVRIRFSIVILNGRLWSARLIGLRSGIGQSSPSL